MSLLNVITDGQKIAKKLCSQITSETKGIKALLPEYNACLLASGVMETLDIKQALDPTELSTLVPSTFSLASGSKRVLIDSFIMMKRSEEELKLLEIEMENTSNHCNSKARAIDNTLTLLSGRGDKHSKGAVALLLKLKTEAIEQQSNCDQFFGVMKQTSVPTMIPLIGEDTESDTDADSSSDDENALGN